MQWLYHVLRAEELSWGKDARYAPASLASEGFIHASYKDRVASSAELYFPADADLRVLAIDPRRLDVPIDIASTPRGPMPHIQGSIPVDAIAIKQLADIEGMPDRVVGTRIGFAAFDGMTLLDLVGPLDVLSRISTMGFDTTTTCEVFSLLEGLVFDGSGITVECRRHRPPLESFDVLVIPGGPETRILVHDGALGRYLATFPANRLLASVCTGALLLGARVKGKRATTHHSSFDKLAELGAEVVKDERVVDEGQLITSGGVTSGIDLGLHLVARLAGADVAKAIAARIEHR